MINIYREVMKAIRGLFGLFILIAASFFRKSSVDQYYRGDLHLGTPMLLESYQMFPTFVLYLLKHLNTTFVFKQV